MGTNKIFLAMLVILVMLRASDSLPRVLMGDEKPNPEKVSSIVDKELHQNQQPKLAGSPSNSNNPPITASRNDGKKDETMKDIKSPQNDKKDEGKKVSNGPSNSEEKNGNDGNEQNEINDPSKSKEKSAKRDDGPKESDGPPKSQDNSIKDDPPNESKVPPKSQENVKMSDGPKQSNDHSNSQEIKKKDDGKKPNRVPSKREENRKMDDGTLEGKVPDGEEIHVDKSQLETCDDSLQKCQVHELVACLWHSEIADFKEPAMVVQNMGGGTLNVNIAVPPSVKIGAKLVILAKHSSKKVNITSVDTKILKIILNAGKGDCVIQMGMETSLSDWLQQFPVYASQMTPIYGAYFLFITLIIGGGMWVFCKFRKRGRRVENGVQYQQLEMGTQIQSNTEIVESSTVDGWEQGWDDDWDEEDVVARPSTTNPNGNVSSIGLSSRSANKKNDWDIEWND